MVYTSRGKTNDKNTLCLQVWAVDKQYTKAFGVMDDSLMDIEKLLKEAQGVIKSRKAHRAIGTMEKGVGLKQDEDLDATAKKFETLLQEAVMVRNQAEMAKLEPCNQEEITAGQLARLKKGLEAQKEYTTAIEKKADEAERLLAALMQKGGSLETASTNSQKKAYVDKGPKIKNELASGVGKNAAVITFGKEKGLQNFKMEEGDSLIIAMWNPQPGVEGGGDVHSLCITRTEGGRAYIAGLTCNSGLGELSKKGITRRSKFPAIEKVEVAQQGKSEGELSVPSMGGITFRFSKESNAWKLDSPRIRRMHTPENTESAPAFIFKMKREGTYSLSGQLVLRAPTPETSIIWMVWTARFE
jgi:hypothetical protein